MVMTRKDVDKKWKNGVARKCVDTKQNMHNGKNPKRCNDKEQKKDTSHEKVTTWNKDEVNQEQTSA
jgi:hypothetical protein